MTERAHVLPTEPEEADPKSSEKAAAPQRRHVTYGFFSSSCTSDHACEDDRQPHEPEVHLPFLSVPFRSSKGSRHVTRPPAWHLLPFTKSSSKARRSVRLPPHTCFSLLFRTTRPVESIESYSAMGGSSSPLSPMWILCAMEGQL